MKNFDDIEVGDKMFCGSDLSSEDTPKTYTVAAVAPGDNGSALVLKGSSSILGLFLVSRPEHWEKVVEPRTFWLLQAEEGGFFERPFLNYDQVLEVRAKYLKPRPIIIEVKEVLKD